MCHYRRIMIPVKKFVVIMMMVFVTLVSLISPAVFSITIKEEEEMSRQMMQMIYKHFDVIDDPVIVPYVNEIGNRILATLPQQPFKYQFHVIKADIYNAFATPAGHIFIYTGLLNAMKDEEELAGILGHEIAHVYCRHISQKIERSKKIGMATLAGVAAGVLMGIGGAGEAAGAVTMGSMAAGQTAELAYSRENEMQADQLGVEFLTKADYSASGLLEILKKIRSKTWFGSDQIPTYLMTHPAVEDRIAFITSWLESYNQKSTPIPPVDPDAFNRAHIRVESRYIDDQVALSAIESEVKRNPEDPMVHYRYGLILARAGNLQEAISHMRIALTKRAFDPHILKDLGWVYYLSGEYQQASKTLDSACSMIPEDPECQFYLGRTQLEMGNLAEASDRLLKVIRQYPGFTQAYYFLGQSLGKQQQLGDAYYYLGVFYLKSRDRKNAIIQLQQALKHLQDDKKREQVQEWLGQLGGKEDKKTSNGDG
ncbi:MAG: M48 family metalloprotease [Deltaproteobacteria bacterium]|nr:M48 family metalloprotease [Deltaproteobacteria bacterium]MBW2479993.1 M48 family metalloprotease [Deltaproteobacteria bacterium]